MKKILLAIIFFLVFILSARSQTLYGTTSNGGNDRGGTISAFIPATNNLIVAKSFESVAAYPTGELIQASDGKLYGMAGRGGNNNGFVIFSFDPSTSTYTKLKDFDFDKGAKPQGSLMQASDGKLYGMTSRGGNSDAGVIFSFDPSSFIYTVVKDFGGNDADGSGPTGVLIQAGDGKLYGMAGGGGTGAGVIFSFDPSSSTYTKLKDFGGTDGAGPNGGLMQASDGKLYGVTYGGGSGDKGVIFSFDPSSLTYRKLNDFGTNASGSNVLSNLVQASNGKLYGMTYGGGSSGAGIIFSFDTSASTYTKLKDFGGTDGAGPLGSLIQASDGKLYGMTGSGGSSDYGVIFSLILQLPLIKSCMI